MDYLFVFIAILSFSNCKGQVEDEVAKKSVKEGTYVLRSIDTTKRFFLYYSENQNKEKVLIVVDKESSQIKGKDIEIDQEYSLKTYGYYDVFTIDANRCHFVDAKQIWCHKDGIELRFTDGMGNDVVEN